jgi:hypothetical protein
VARADVPRSRGQRQAMECKNDDSAERLVKKGLQAAETQSAKDRLVRGIVETNRIHLILFGMRSRTLGHVWHAQ